MLLFALVALLIQPFPAIFVAQLSLYFGYGLTFYGGLWKSVRPTPWLVAAVLVVVGGAVFASAWTYQLPVGTFSFSAGGSVPAGRYLLVGDADAKKFLWSCGPGSSSVAQAAPEVIQLEAARTPDQQRSLLDLVLTGTPILVEGPLAAC